MDKIIDGLVKRVNSWAVYVFVEAVPSANRLIQVENVCEIVPRVWVVYKHGGACCLICTKDIRRIVIE